MMIWITLSKNKIKSLNSFGFAFLNLFFDCLKFILPYLFKDDHMMTFYCLYLSFFSFSVTFTFNLCVKMILNDFLY